MSLMSEKEWFEFTLNFKVKIYEINFHKWDKDCPKCVMGQNHIVINAYVPEADIK